jgi:hypothetical protein
VTVKGKGDVRDSVESEYLKRRVVCNVSAYVDECILSAETEEHMYALSQTFDEFCTYGRMEVNPTKCLTRSSEKAHTSNVQYASNAGEQTNVVGRSGWMFRKIQEM